MRRREPSDAQRSQISTTTSLLTPSRNPDTWPQRQTPFPLRSLRFPVQPSHDGTPPRPSSPHPRRHPSLSPRTLSTYWTAWKCFKSFHTSHHLTLPSFDLLSITSLISYAHTHLSIHTSTIHVYLRGTNLFCKLLSGSPCTALSNSQTFLLMKGLKPLDLRSPSARLALTADLLAACIHTLHTGYSSPSTDSNLEAMFLLAFFVFLRCSEFTSTSHF